MSKEHRQTIRREMIENRLVINEDIKVTEYSPDVFAFLREQDGFSNEILR